MSGAGRGALVLALETSCDESAGALMRGRELLSAEVFSQIPIHREYGGVVPEVASRNHLKALKPVLQNAIAYYLLVARGRDGSAVDPVARFHLGNGARLARVNWMADLSAKSIAQAAGFMVNYHYVPADIERNHEAFANQGEVATVHAVKRLLRDPEPLSRRQARGVATPA